MVCWDIPAVVARRSARPPGRPGAPDSRAEDAQEAAEELVEAGLDLTECLHRDVIQHGLVRVELPRERPELGASRSIRLKTSDQFANDVQWMSLNIGRHSFRTNVSWSNVMTSSSIVWTLAVDWV